MGDRVSISFVNESTVEIPRESIAFFAHWDGMDLVDDANEYVENLKKYLEENDSKGVNPLGRLRPDTVMTDFVRHMTHSKERVTGNYYLAATGNDGDNSDNGHHRIYLT